MTTLFITSQLLSGDSDPDGTGYVGSLSQCLFHTLSRAMEDSQAVFPSPQPGLHCIFVVWARKETVNCCNLIKEHALSALAGPSGLAPTVHCVCLAIVYAMLLEEGHQLSLVNLVRHELRNCIEGWCTCPISLMLIAHQQPILIFLWTQEYWTIIFEQ